MTDLPMTKHEESMSEKAEHTPLPWAACGRWVCEENDPGHNVGICVCEDRITEAETFANAALIVRSVNSLPYLVEALDRIANHPRHQNPANEMQCIARAALSKYRGERG